MSLTTQDIVYSYRKAFSLLQGYDEGFQKEAQQAPHEGSWSLAEARIELQGLKHTLKAAGEATDLFAAERGDAFETLWGNLEATVFGELAYATVERRAAHVLYFVVKNHPFSDGNKRSGAFLFLSYLNRQGRLHGENGGFAFSPEAVAAMVVLVAESAPEQKDLLIELLTQMISRGKS